MADTEAQLQAYLAEHDVEALLKEIVVELCLHKPESPLAFIKSFVEKKMGPEVAAGGSAEGSEEEEPLKYRRASRRGAISASVMGTSEAMAYEKKVVAKDAATMLRLQEAIKNNLLFQHLDKEEMTDVLDAMFVHKCAAGDMIIKQGDEGDNFYCIDSGTVEVWKADEEGGESKHLSDIGEGGSFGELALIYGQPRAASIKAKTDCAFFAIDRDTYRRILMQSTIKKRKLYETFLEKVQLLNSLDKWERLAVADALEPANFEDGAVIIKQGEEGADFFIVVEGSAVVTQTNDEGETGEVAQLGPAQYFGEIALLNHEPRKATVTAAGELKCVKLDRDRFERVLGPCEDILRRNMENYEQFKPSA